MRTIPQGAINILFKLITIPLGWGMTIMPSTKLDNAKQYK